jgi:hypothetical protein
MQGVDERQRPVFQEQLDLLKRDTQELQCGNLFQAFQVFQTVEAAPGASALRLEQTNAIVVVQRSNGYPCQFREFANPVAAAHRSATIVGPDAGSRSSGELADVAPYLNWTCFRINPVSGSLQFPDQFWLVGKPDITKGLDF